MRRSGNTDNRRKTKGNEGGQEREWTQNRTETRNNTRKHDRSNSSVGERGQEKTRTRPHAADVGSKGNQRTGTSTSTITKETREQERRRYNKQSWMDWGGRQLEREINEHNNNSKKVNVEREKESKARNNMRTIAGSVRGTRALSVGAIVEEKLA